MVVAVRPRNALRAYYFQGEMEGYEMTSVRLRAGVPLARLEEGIVQVGTGATHSVLITNATDKDIECLELLRHGAHAHEVDSSLLEALKDAGLLEESAKIWQQYLCVRIVGLGRIGTLIARTLADDGVPYIDVRDGRPVDATLEGIYGEEEKGMRRDVALRQWLTNRGVHWSRGRTPHVAITVDEGVQDWGTAANLLYQDIPHLPIVTEDREVFIGPLSIPGTTPCFQCVERSRLEAVPGWKYLREAIAQEPPAEPTWGLAHTSAGIAANIIFTLLTCGSKPEQWPATQSWLVGTAGMHLLEWTVHPECGCSTSAV